jgi:hypothetical protein
VTAGTRVEGGVAAGCVGAGVAAGAVAGVGTVVATVAGAEHATNVSDAHTSSEAKDVIGRATGLAIGLVLNGDRGNDVMAGLMGMGNPEQ